MARQRRSRSKHGDPIGDLQEWQQHQYDPGYLANLGRLRLFSAGRSSAARLLLTRLGAIMALVLIWVVLVSTGMSVAIASVIVGLLMFGVLIVTLIQVLQIQEHRSRRQQRRRP